MNEFLVGTTDGIFSKKFPQKNAILRKCYQNLVRNVRHCNKFAKFAILVQTCKILVRNAKLARIRKIRDCCNLGMSHFYCLLTKLTKNSSAKNLSQVQKVISTKDSANFLIIQCCYINTARLNSLHCIWLT